MARYDYRCPACDTQFEVEHPMSERPEVRCPACGEVASQVFSASGIVFKGSGFYNTDQRKGAGGATSATSSSASTSSSDSSTSSDSASSAKTSDTSKASASTSAKGDA